MKYVTFRGRASRSEYWNFLLAALVIALPAILIDLTIIKSGAALSCSPMCMAIALFLLLPGIAVGIRRLHDIGRSGWWLSLLFLPVIGWAVLLALFCKKGTPNANDYSLPAYMQTS